jgi:hypothetical protein
LTSKQIGALINGSRECVDEGFENVGYNFFDDEQVEENYFISSLKKNVGHDLRLVKSLTRKSPLISSLFSRIIYGTYGTNEVVSNSTDNAIRNVTDMYSFLRNFNIDMLPTVKENDTSMGCIEVYMTNKLCQKEMKFIPIK